MKTNAMVEKLTEFFKQKVTNRSKREQLSREKYNDHLDSVLDEAMDWAYQKGNSDANNDVCDTSRVSARLWQEGSNNRLKNHLVDQYCQILDVETLIINEEDRISKMDLRERRRFLRYRIYTALGIATVVFVLAAISHFTGITLPFSAIRSIGG